MVCLHLQNNCPSPFFDLASCIVLALYDSMWNAVPLHAHYKWALHSCAGFSIEAKIEAYPECQ